MIEKTMDFNPNQVRTTAINTSISKIRYSQYCLTCNNTRVLPEGMYYCNTPWVCDECKEAIAFLKDFKKQTTENAVLVDKIPEIQLC